MPTAENIQRAILEELAEDAGLLAEMANKFEELADRALKTNEVRELNGCAKLCRSRARAVLAILKRATDSPRPPR